VTDEAPEVVVVGSVPVRHQRCGPLVDVVDDIRQRRIRPDHQNRSEDFFVSDSHVLVDVTHDRGRDLSSGTVGQRFPCGSDGFDRRTVGPGVVDEPDDAVEVGLVDRGTVVVVGDDRREHAAQCLARGVDEVVDAVMGHEDIVGADTHLSPVDHSRLGDARSRSVDVGIRRHHHRILAAQLQRDRDEVLRGGLLHQ